MVSSVSGMSNAVAFKSSAMDKVTPEMMSQPSSFSQESAVSAEKQAPEKKKGSMLGFIAKTALAVIAIGGGAIALRKNVGALGKESISLLENKETLTFIDKVKINFAKYTDMIEAGTIGKLSEYFKKNTSELTTAKNFANKADGGNVNTVA